MVFIELMVDMSAIVEPKVIYLEQNRVDLIFEIEEGPLSK